MGLTITADGVSTGTVSPTLSQWFIDLYTDIGEWSFHTRSLSSDQTTNAKRWTNRGYRSFLSAYPWSCLDVIATVSLWGGVTGVMAVTGGTTITDLTNTPFTSAMVGHTLTSSSGTVYTITAYTSSSVVTVGTTATADNGDSFVVASDGDYDLPTGFSCVRGGRILHASNAGYAPIQRVDPSRILQLRASSTSGGPPIYWAVTPATFVVATGQQWTLMVWPTPAATYSVKVPYRAVPTLLSADSDNPVGGMLFNDAIRAFGLQEAERATSDTPGPMAELAARELEKAIRMDGHMRIVGPIPITDGPNGECVGLVNHPPVTGSASSTNGRITWS